MPASSNPLTLVFFALLKIAQGRSQPAMSHVSSPAVKTSVLAGIGLHAFLIDGGGHGGAVVGVGHIRPSANDHIRHAAPTDVGRVPTSFIASDALAGFRTAL